MMTVIGFTELVPIILFAVINADTLSRGSCKLPRMVNELNWWIMAEKPWRGGSPVGGDLWGTGGQCPKKFEVGTTHASVSPNISRTTVIGCDAKYELTKRMVFRTNLEWWNISFWWKKGKLLLYFRFQTAETGKVQRMTKKRSTEFFRNSFRTFGLRKFSFPSPPKNSGPSLRPWAGLSVVFLSA